LAIGCSWHFEAVRIGEGWMLPTLAFAVLIAAQFAAVFFIRENDFPEGQRRRRPRALLSR
jgi:hypothetical protein